MATEAVVVTGTVNTTVSGTTDLTSSGFGTPTAAIVFCSSANTTNNPQGGLQVSVGFYDGTNQRVCGVSSEDAVSPSNSARTTSAQVIRFPNFSGTVVETTASASTITDGIRLTTNAHSGSNAEHVVAILIKGTTNSSAFNTQLTVDGTNDITSVGFQPDVVFITTAGYNSYNANTTQSIFGFGCVHWDSGATKTQRYIGLFSQDAQNTSNAAITFRTDACTGQYYNNTQSWSGNATNPDASGFSIITTNSPSNDYILCLALKLADADDFYLDTLNQKTTTGTDATTGLGFQPDVVGVAMSFADSVAGTDGDVQLSFGASDTTTESTLAIFDEDAVGTTNSFAKQSAQIINIVDSTGSSEIAADLQSLDSDGFTLDYTTTNATTRYGFAFAFGDSTAGGGSYTLDAAQGSFALTGQSSNLLLGRSLSAANGSFTFTGQTADLLLGRFLSAANGNFTLNGQDSQLIVARLLTADIGSFALSGQDANLVYAPIGSYTLTAENGTFALTGNNSGLIYDRQLIADQGSLTLSGQDASLQFGLTLSAESGNFTLTGQDATFPYSRTLTADVGSFTVDGKDASLLYAGSGSYIMVASQGSFVLNGQDVNFFGFVVPSENTELELPIQNAITVSIYNGLGESMTYVGTLSGTVSLKAIINRGDDLFPGNYQAQAADADVTARIQIVDIAQPRRDDVVIGSNGVWYKVDSYQKLNESEWTMELRHG